MHPVGSSFRQAALALETGFDRLNRRLPTRRVLCECGQPPGAEPFIDRLILRYRVAQTCSLRGKLKFALHEITYS